MGELYLVAGLGNPGPPYAKTRHNVGFEVVDHLIHRYRMEAGRPQKQALVSRGMLSGCETLLCKPQTYMNDSGAPVGALLRYFKIPVEHLVVVHDELDFEVGEVRLKQGGGHGGHNGLRSLIACVGAEFGRIRMGIGKPPSKASGADFVLSRFNVAEREWIDNAVVQAGQAVETVLQVGIKAAMNELNRR